MQNKVLSYISLACKAGKIKSGEFAAEKALKEGIACLILVADDASDNTKKHFRDMCSYRHIDYRIFGTKDELGHACGKDMRSSIAVCDVCFSKCIEKQLMTEVEN